MKNHDFRRVIVARFHLSLIGPESRPDGAAAVAKPEV
jgi:hypothetical protein